MKFLIIPFLMLAATFTANADDCASGTDAAQAEKKACAADAEKACSTASECSKDSVVSTASESSKEMAAGSTAVSDPSAKRAKQAKQAKQACAEDCAKACRATMPVVAAKAKVTSTAASAGPLMPCCAKDK